MAGRWTAPVGREVIPERNIKTADSVARNTTGRGLRPALAAAIALGLILAVGGSTVALADGGAGGASGSGAAGGAGGAGFTGNPGQDGTAFGGGGGGGGSGGGAGGQGAALFDDGGNNNVGGGGSGGGGGGSHARGPAPTISNGAPSTGVAGGIGGPGGDAFAGFVSSRGGGGGGGGAGGSGAVATGSGSNTNVSTLTGGTGGGGGNGGRGGSFTSATGGDGGSGGDGGAGVAFIGPAATFTNVGTVSGGTGGDGGAGGEADSFDSATSGIGGSGGAGGAGVVFAGSAATFTNMGTVSGGNGAGGGAVGAAGSFDTTAGGTGGSGGAGGAGVVFAGPAAIFTNAGTVSGGSGGGGQRGGDATSRFTTTGGAGGSGGAGGAGVAFAGSAATFTNAGTVSGGSGGGGGAGGLAINLFGAGIANLGGAGGAGGTGIAFAGPGAAFTNSGTVSGGGGGNGGTGGSATNFANDPAGAAGVGGAGGAGGVGVSFASPRAAFVNAGTVTGGNGGAGGAAGTGTAASTAGAAGAGGVGVIANGITIDNRGGTISGGFANGGAGPRAFAIQLNGGANFIGTGGTIIGGIDVQGGASFQPARPASTIGAQPLAITGPLRFAQTSTYNIRISPTGNDRTNVTGTATLNGASVHVQGKTFGVYQASTWTILTATMRSGTFGAVSTNLAFLNPTLSYDANNVYLTISTGGTFVIPGLTQNERNVALALTNVALQGTRGPGRKIINALNNLNPSQAAAVLDSLSGEGIAASQNIAFRAAQLFNSAIFDQTTFYGTGGATNSVTLTAPVAGMTALATPEQTLAAANAGKPVRELADLPSAKVEPAVPVAVQRTWRAWGTGFGGVENINGNRQIGSARQENSIIGGALGVDYQLLPNYLVGVAVGGTDGTFQVRNRGTSGSTDGGHIAIYDIATFGKFYGASSSSFSYYGNKTTRFTGGFGGLASEQERGNFGSHEFRTRLEFGRHFDNEFGLGGPGGALGALGAVTPFLALELAELRSNGFTETSVSGPGLLRLNVSGQSIGSAPGFVGARFQRVTPLGNGMVFSPTLQVAYVHEFAPYRSQIGQIASLPGSVFLVDGARPARDAAQVKAGGELSLGPRAALFANFDGEFSGVNQLYAGKGGFRYLW